MPAMPLNVDLFEYGTYIMFVEVAIRGAISVMSEGPGIVCIYNVAVFNVYTVNLVSMTFDG
jgi:hypothetical protein